MTREELISALESAEEDAVFVWCADCNHTIGPIEGKNGRVLNQGNPECRSALVSVSPAIILKAMERDDG